MKRTTSNFAVALAALGLAACSDVTGPDVSDLAGSVIEGEWCGQLALGAKIEIKGIQGDIVASTATGQQVTVSWKKRGEKDDPDVVAVDVVAHAGGVTICAVYPDVPGGQHNYCAPGGSGHMATREINVAVDFTVLVPAGVDFDGSTISGDVRAANLESNAFGSTISGDVELSTTELAEASTVSGSVDVAFGRTQWSGELRFSAVSGSVEVSVHGNANAEVWASSANGSVNSDFDLPRLVDGTLRGNIGIGGGLLRLSTVTGSVRLQRAS